MSEEEDTCLRRRVTIRIMTPKLMRSVSVTSSYTVSHHHTVSHHRITIRIMTPKPKEVRRMIHV
jgi:hypothetical protein